MSNAYKTLFVGSLEQQTAFSTGGSDEQYSSQVVDHPIARDGGGRLTLPGTGLAGSFISTARAICKFDLPSWITEGLSDDSVSDWRLEESVWIFHHAHPLVFSPRSPIRSGVQIDSYTGAAVPETLHDTETTPPGTTWWFCIEVDDYRDRTTNAPSASEIAARVVECWTQCCWLGRNVARGMGWMKLRDVSVYTLTTDDIQSWPNSAQEPQKTVEKFKTRHKSTLENYLADKTDGGGCSNFWTSQDLYLTTFVNIDVGKKTSEVTDDYGVDSLSVSSSAKNDDDILWDGLASDGSLFYSQGMNVESIRNLFDPDANLAWWLVPGDEGFVPELYLPGSSIRGALKHALIWQLERESNPEMIKTGVCSLFGSMTQSAHLLVSDARFRGNETAKVALFEHHAEDEFTQGVYGTSKFNRPAIMRGEFQFQLIVELDPTDNHRQHLFESFLERWCWFADRAFLPLGGGQRRGHGWIRWTFGVPEQVTNEEKANVSGKKRSGKKHRKGRPRGKRRT